MKVKFEGRLSFPALFSPSAKFGKFGARFILPKGSKDEKALRAAVESVGTEQWADKWPAVKKSLQTKDKFLLHDGDAKADEYPEYENTTYLNTNSKVRPVVNDRDANPAAEEDGLIYAGCYVNAIIDIFAGVHKDSGEKYLSAKLLGVQFVKDGEAFGGAGSKIEEGDFAPLEGSDADDIL